MRRGWPALFLAVLAAPSCGESPPSAPAAADDVKGSSFLVTAPAAPAPGVADLGDVDGAKPAGAPAAPIAPAAEPAPPPVADAAPPSPEGPAPAADASDYEATSFDELAGFQCAEYASTEKHEIPAKILALAGRKLVVDGYMMPLQYEAGGAKKFLLMRYQFGCCYAVSPKVNEWIEVTMEKGVADYMPDTIASVWGVLSIQEELREGASVGLYKMKATRAELSEAK